jgi:flagellar assembly protein FliH
MSKMWSADHAARAERRRLIEGEPVLVDLYADGFAAGRLAVDAEWAAERAMLVAMIEAAADLRAEGPEPLAVLLQDTVMRLVSDVVGAAAVDADLLRERALALAAAICGPEGPVLLRVHPDCVTLLEGLRGDIEVCGDGAVVPGQIVRTVARGTLEDGVESALDRVRAALGVAS